MQVTKRDGSKETADRRKIARCVERACRGLKDVDTGLITDEAFAQLYEDMPTWEIDRATVLAARARITNEPNYSYAAARLLLHSLYRESFGHRVDARSLAKDYRAAFVANVQRLIGAGRLDTRMADSRRAGGIFDLSRLAAAIQPERDLLLKYLGVQTLYDRYLLHEDGRRLETPQAFWMRVAMGVSLGKKDPTAAAISAYNLFSTLRYCPATPTLFNAGTTHPQLSSCYLSTMDDSIDGIYGCLHNQARLSKYAGGLGIDLTPLRGLGSYIRGTNGKSQGIVPWAKQLNAQAVAVNQGGKRKGASALYLELWHIDIEDFQDLRKNTGDDRRRCHDIDTANWIPDEFMCRVEAGADWYLFSPDECPDLHSLYGHAFSRRYAEYIKAAKRGDIKNYKVIKAKDLWRKMLTAIKETSHPWLTFKDPCNIRYANQHAGTVNSSNLCTEVIEHTKPTLYVEQEVVQLGETAVCTLGSVNVAAHADEQGSIDWALLEATVTQATDILDSLLDHCYYPTREARLSTERNRFIGLGMMGWHDLLHKKRLVFDSQEAVDLADEVHEFISWHAIMQSAKMGAERGSYPNFEGSAWSQGKVPIDTYLELASYRLGGEMAETTYKLDWGKARAAVKAAMRNGLVMAIAPTATISFIVGCSQSIEPALGVLYVQSTLSGDFAMVSEFFVKEMKKLGLWNADVAKKLAQADGDVVQLAFLLNGTIPNSVVDRFKGAFDIDQFKLIDACAARQKWIDQGQSMNVYYAGDSMKELSNIYFHSWRRLIKTNYYLHSKAASRVEKSTVEAASPSCKVGEVCEACQ
jgi:ribonucleoside-diphosphate reductase alpha chain